MSIHQHLLDRHFTDEEINKSGVIINEDECVATFLLYNALGEITGYQEYRPFLSKNKNNIRLESRYFSYMTKEKPSYWGQHSLNVERGVLYITEGIMDAARLTSKGYQAVAVLSNDPKKLYDQIKIWKARYLVIALVDNDHGGKFLAKYADMFHVMQSDVGDSSEEELENILRKITEKLLPNNY